MNLLKYLWSKIVPKKNVQVPRGLSHGVVSHGNNSFGRQMEQMRRLRDYAVENGITVITSHQLRRSEYTPGVEPTYRAEFIKNREPQLLLRKLL